MFLSLIFLAMIAVPFVLLVADLVRGGGRGRRDGRTAPPAPSYGDQLTRHGA